jgi:hypothetical protein
METIKRILYAGDDKGKLSYGDFERYMQNIHGAILCLKKFGMSETFQIWHINACTLTYRNNGGEPITKVIISGIGASDKIEGLQKIVDDAKRE